MSDGIIEQEIEQEIIAHNLSKETPDLNDYLLMTDTSNDGEVCQAMVSALARLAIEQYAGTTLFGVAQTVKSAVNSLCYSSGNTISGIVWLPGAITNGKTDVFFLIPLTRPIKSGCTLQTSKLDITLRSGGDYHWGGADYQSSVLPYLVYANINNGGIAVKLSNSGWGNKGTLTNNDLVSLYVDYTFVVS